jgi:site-specific DNA-methyltransferase (adenine-specific)
MISPSRFPGQNLFAAKPGGMFHDRRLHPLRPGDPMSFVLHLGDCLDPVTGLASLADKSVDAVVTDPPYSETTHAGARSHKDIDAKSVDFSSFTVEQLFESMAVVGRVARRWVIATIDWRHMHLLDSSPPHGLRFVRFGLWVKPNGAPQFTGDRPAVGWEAIAILHAAGGRMRWNGGGDRSIFTRNVEHGDHPTQKPVLLLEDFVRLFTDPGETILDPFAGSGTTGVAAIRLGRNFIGWEKDPKYHAIALKRLNAAREQLELIR